MSCEDINDCIALVQWLWEKLYHFIHRLYFVLAFSKSVGLVNKSYSTHTFQELVPCLGRCPADIFAQGTSYRAFDNLRCGEKFYAVKEFTHLLRCCGFPGAYSSIDFDNEKISQWYECVPNLPIASNSQAANIGPNLGSSRLLQRSFRSRAYPSESWISS